MRRHIDRRLVLIILPIFVLAAVLYQYYNKSVDLDAIFRVANDKKYQYFPDFSQSKYLNDLDSTAASINMGINKYVEPGNFGLSRVIYLVDAVKIINDTSLPYKVRKYYREHVFHNGITYTCYGTVIFDSSMMIDISPKLAIGPQENQGDKFLKKRYLDDKVSLEIDFLFKIVHEMSHVVQNSYNDPTGLIERNYINGTKLLQEGKLEGAKIELGNVLKYCPAHYEAIDNLAVVERRLGNAISAEKLYLRSLKINTESSIAKQNLVLVLLEQHKLDIAQEYAEKFYKADPNNPEFSYFLGSIAIQQKRYDTAQLYLEKCHGQYVLASNPSAVEVALLLTKLSREVGNLSLYRTAIKNLREDCRLFSNNAEVATLCSKIFE